jgi:hypothetical protein
MPERIGKKQIVLIHLAKAQLGLSGEEYRALLLQRYPGCFTGSCLELSYQEAHDLIEHFKSLGFKVKKKARPKTPPGIPKMVHRNDGIMKRIDHLKADISWHVHDGYERFLKKRFGIERIKTTKEAAKVIEALKAMKARQQGAGSRRAAR